MGLISSSCTDGAQERKPKVSSLKPVQPIGVRHQLVAAPKSAHPAVGQGVDPICRKEDPLPRVNLRIHIRGGWTQHTAERRSYLRGREGHQSDVHHSPLPTGAAGDVIPTVGRHRQEDGTITHQ